MEITGDVLEALGFEQQNPPHIWDYTEPHLRGQKFSSMHWSYRLAFVQDGWTLTVREFKDSSVSGSSGIRVKTVMEIISHVAKLSRAIGVAETQTALHAALGLDKLKQDILDRLPSED